jgi:uncharacterized SAM-binding protein YcdF (DUF218 family)
MREILLNLGVADEQIVVEDTARNTLQSAVRCSAMLREREDVGSVILCSSRYHILRCRMLMRLNGVRSGASVVSRDAHRVGSARYGYAWIREGVALPFDALIMTGRRLVGAFAQSGKK